MFGKMKRVQDFLGKEKKRRQAAEDFLRFAAQVTKHVAEDIWGTSDDADIKVGEKTVFRLNKAAFYSEEKTVISQNGTSFWESVREVKEFLDTLVEDVREREEGRNRLVGEMQGLAKEISSDPSFRFNKRASL